MCTIQKNHEGGPAEQLQNRVKTESIQVHSTVFTLQLVDLGLPVQAAKLGHHSGPPNQFGNCASILGPVPCCT